MLTALSWLIAGPQRQRVAGLAGTAAYTTPFARGEGGTRLPLLLVPAAPNSLTETTKAIHRSYQPKKLTAATNQSYQPHF